MDSSEDKFRNTVTYLSAGDWRGREWRKACHRYIGEDPWKENPDVISWMRWNRLEGDLHVPGVTKPEEAVPLAYEAIVTMIREETEFDAAAFLKSLWRKALSDYLMFAARLTGVRRSHRSQLDHEDALFKKRAKLGDLLFAATHRTFIRREQLFTQLVAKGIKVSGGLALDLLLAEINRKGERPRILGIMPSRTPLDTPFYVFIPDTLPMTREIRLVCQIFDH